MSKFRLTNIGMVEPAAFGFNSETAATNRFQHADAPEQTAPATGSTESIAASIAALAKSEFQGAVASLRAAGVQVAVAEDSATPSKPDAVFPNNWVSFHADGTVFIYPMCNPSRRSERREAVIDEFKQQLGFVERRRIDLSIEERHGRFLEGTGSLVLDDESRRVYACRSARTDEALVREWARLMDYEAVIFDAATPDGTPVYHTNVLLWIGRRICAAGLEWIDPAQRDSVAACLRKSDGRERDLLVLDNDSLMGFAGNMLEISVAEDRQVLAMSATAAVSLTPAQRQQLINAGCEIIAPRIPTIERLGGGSLRCMLVEIPAQ